MCCFAIVLFDVLLKNNNSIEIKVRPLWAACTTSCLQLQLIEKKETHIPHIRGFKIPENSDKAKSEKSNYPFLYILKGCTGPHYIRTERCLPTGPLRASRRPSPRPTLKDFNLARWWSPAGQRPVPARVSKINNTSLSKHLPVHTRNTPFFPRGGLLSTLLAVLLHYKEREM